MQEHEVAIDDASLPSRISFSPVFNVAVPFIDRHVAEGRAARPALRAGGDVVTYGVLAGNVNRCGRIFGALGLARGDRVLMAVRDCPEFFYAFWGAVKAGMIPIPVNTLLRTEDYEFLVGDSECAAVLYSTEIGDAVRPAVEAGSNDCRVALPTRGPGSLAERLPDAPADLEPAATAAVDECFWLYSSGSTGAPKGVVHRHRDMVVTSERFGRGIAGIGPDDVVFCAGKLFFSYGFGGGMTFPLWAGASIVLVEERPTPEIVFAIIETYRPTVFFGVPTLYAQLLHAAQARAPDLGSIRLGVSAGEALPAHVFHRMRERFGFTVIDGIGSTEALHIFVSNRIDDLKPGTSGKVVPGYEVRIVGEDGMPVPDGEIGTLHVKGDSTARRYWNHPGKTAATMLGDWLNTGDMYHVDEEGYYVNAGRGDDMFKVGAMWCSPIEIEDVLIRHPGVREAAVVGRLDEDGLEKPEAFVVLEPGTGPGPELVEALTARCRDSLARYKYPRWYNWIDELPKTVTGKIQRYRLRR